MLSEVPKDGSAARDIMVPEWAGMSYDAQYDDIFSKPLNLRKVRPRAAHRCLRGCALGAGCSASRSPLWHPCRATSLPVGLQQCQPASCTLVALLTRRQASSQPTLPVIGPSCFPRRTQTCLLRAVRVPHVLTCAKQLNWCRGSQCLQATPKPDPDAQGTVPGAKRIPFSDVYAKPRSKLFFGREYTAKVGLGAGPSNSLARLHRRCGGMPARDVSADNQLSSRTL